MKGTVDKLLNFMKLSDDEEYDEEYEEYACVVSMDEDDYARFCASEYKNCPYYQSNDEYKIVRHQM